jgi:hypothetical protein
MDAASTLLLQHCRVAQELFNQLKNWIRCRVPRIEDGNNFGVEVQVGVLF